jgi:hypothetical protein
MNKEINLDELNDDDILVFSLINADRFGTMRITVARAKEIGLPSDLEYVFTQVNKNTQYE